MLTATACTPTTSPTNSATAEASTPAGDATGPATDAPSLTSESAAPTATDDAPAFDPADVIDLRGALFLADAPSGMTEGDGYPDQSGWRTLAVGTCTLYVRDAPLDPSGDEPVYLQEPSQDRLIEFSAAELGLDFQALDVADLPLASERADSGEAMFAEARGEAPDGSFSQVASRVTWVAVDDGTVQPHGVDLHYSCPTEASYTASWPDVAQSLTVGIWTSDLWWGGN